MSEETKPTLADSLSAFLSDFQERQKQIAAMQAEQEQIRQALVAAFNIQPVTPVPEPEPTVTPAVTPTPFVLPSWITGLGTTLKQNWLTFILAIMCGILLANQFKGCNVIPDNILPPQKTIYETLPDILKVVPPTDNTTTIPEPKAVLKPSIDDDEVTGLPSYSGSYCSDGSCGSYSSPARTTRRWRLFR